MSTVRRREKLRDQLRLRRAVVALVLVQPRQGDVVLDYVVQRQLIEIQARHAAVAVRLPWLAHPERGEGVGEGVREEVPPIARTTTAAAAAVANVISLR